MVRGSDLIVPSAGALARPKARKTGTAVAAGLAVINDALNVDVVQAIADASGIRKANQQNITVRDGDIALAKSLLARCLPSLARVYEVHRVLSSIVHPREPITPAEAMAMLRYLFGAMGKRRGDDATAKLFACADIFSPADAALADAFGFWKQTPTSRAVLGIAIKRLMATGVMSPRNPSCARHSTMCNKTFGS
jgi:hypothetical protein